MKKAKSDLKIALYIRNAIKPDYSFGTQGFEYGFVTVNEKGEVRNPSDYGEQAAFTDLQCRCQASSDMCDGKPYAYHTEYHGVTSVNQSGAERMLKTFKRLTKIISGFQVQPETFGQYVQLICIGLKIDAVMKAGKGAGGWHSETEHTTWKVSEIQWLIDTQVNDFLKEHTAAMAVQRAR